MCWYYQLLLCWNATGFVVGSATQANFSRQGFVFGMLSSLLVALYSTSVKKVLHIHTPHTLHTHTHNALRNALLFTHRCLFYLCQKGVTHTHSTHTPHTHTPRTSECSPFYSSLSIPPLSKGLGIIWAHSYCRIDGRKIPFFCNIFIYRDRERER
jgi:hypothetical protein